MSHEVTQGIRQEPPARRNRYAARGRCESRRGGRGDGGTLNQPWDKQQHVPPPGLLHSLAYRTWFGSVSANSRASVDSSQAESHLIIVSSSVSDNMVRMLRELMVKMNLNDYSISSMIHL